MLALVSLSTLGAGSSYLPDVLLPFLLLGLGAGTSFLPLMTLAMAGVPATDAGLASGIVNASLQISAAIGVAVLGTVAADHTQSLLAGGSAAPQALSAGYTLAWTIGAASVLAGVAVAAALLRRQPALASRSPAARAAEPARAPRR